MRSEKIGNHTIQFFDSAENMPMKRYQKFNKFLAKDNEIGSDFSDFNQRSLKAIEYLKKDMKDEAVKELENRRMMVFNAFKEYSPKHNSLAILVHSIDGQIYTDVSTDGLQEIIDKLDEIGFTQEQVKETVSQVKKNYFQNLKSTIKASLGVPKVLSTILNYLKNLELKLT